MARGTDRVDELFARSGLSLQPIFSLNKLLWHREHEPDAWARSVRWLMLADFIAYRLCGETATDLSLASRTLMLDLHRKCWHEKTLTQAEIDQWLLAPLVPAGTPLGTITSGAAALTGLPLTAVVAAGGHDHVCGALAAGVTRPGQMLNSLGTAEAVFLPIEQPLVDPKAGSQGYTQGAHVVGGGYYAFARSTRQAPASNGYAISSAPPTIRLRYEELIAGGGACSGWEPGRPLLASPATGEPAVR